MPENETWLTPKQVADQLQLNYETVLDWVKAGRLRGAKLGKVIRISPDALAQFLHQAEQGQQETEGPDERTVDRLSDLEGTVRQYDQLFERVAKLEQLAGTRPTPPAKDKAAHEPTQAPAPIKADDSTPAATESGQADRLTMRQAFEALGGDRSDPGSSVRNLRGDKTVKWNTFRLTQQTDYPAFGFDLIHETTGGKSEYFLVKRPTPSKDNQICLFPLGATT